MTAPPLVLAYDDLPPGSDIRREHSPEMVRITIPAGEPSRAALTEAWHEALIFAAYLGGIGLLAIALPPFLVAIDANRISGLERVLAWGFFGLLCVAFVLLFAWTQFLMIRNRFHVSHQQLTVIAATPSRLVIESSGPLGKFSHDVPTDEIRQIRICWGKWQGAREHRMYPMRNLRVFLDEAGERFIDIVPGRCRAELNFISRSLLAMTRHNVRTA